MVAVAWFTAVLAIGIYVLFPMRAGDMRSHAHPSSSYAEASELVAAIQRQDDSVVARGGRSILLTHGARTPRVVVLFHGLTDSPTQFLPLAEDLYAAGDNVFVPRLPHHAELAGNIRTLEQLNRQQLRVFADRSIDAAAGLGDTVVVAGLSVGGNIAAWAAQYRPEVRRALLIAPAIALTHVPEHLNATVIRVALRAPNVRHSQPIDSTQPDRLPGWATHLLAEVLMFGNAVRDEADKHAPAAGEVALLLNANDRTVAPGPAIELMTRWSAHGARASIWELADSLRLPHDVVDPRETGSDTAAVYPVLAALIDSQRPPLGSGAVHVLSISARLLPRTPASSAPAPR